MNDAELTAKINAMHKSFLEDIHKIFQKKNSDYGNSFFKLNRGGDLFAPFFDIQRKYIRLKSIIEKQRRGEEIDVEDETFTDTLLDLANYCTMVAVLIKLNSAEGHECYCNVCSKKIKKKE